MSSSIASGISSDGVALMTLNRAPVNALNPEFLADIAQHLDAFEKDKTVRAVVLNSAFKVFSAGLDLKEALEFSVEDQTDIVDGLNTTFAKLYGFPKPVIVAVNGSAIAGGLFFVLSADYAVAAEGAQLGLAEVRVGANFPVGPLEIARAALAPGSFRRLLLRGLPVSAAEAKHLQIIDDVQPAENILAEAMDVARDYASLPQQAYAKIKTQMRAPTLAIINMAIKNKSDPARTGWFSDETKPAILAMLNTIGT